MGDFFCNDCRKNFASNYSLKRHRNGCYSGGSKTNKQIRFKCQYCSNSFTRKDSLSNHINKGRCKKYIKNITQTTKNITNRNKKIKIATGNSSIVNNGNMKMIGTNSGNFIINLCFFAKDGIKCIDLTDFPEIFGSNKNIIESMISKVNLNPNKPQHHNVYYGDTKSSYGEIYENKKWIRKKIDEILEMLIESKIDDLNSILNDMKDFLNKKTRDKIKQTIENFDCTKPGARKKLKSYLKPILYNHKEMIIKTRKLTKEQEEEIFRKEQEEAEKEAREEEEALKLKRKNTKKKFKCK